MAGSQLGRARDIACYVVPVMVALGVGGCAGEPKAEPLRIEGRATTVPDWTEGDVVHLFGPSEDPRSGVLRRIVHEVTVGPDGELGGVREFVPELPEVCVRHTVFQPVWMYETADHYLTVHCGDGQAPSQSRSYLVRYTSPDYQRMEVVRQFLVEPTLGIEPIGIQPGVSTGTPGGLLYWEEGTVDCSSLWVDHDGGAEPLDVRFGSGESMWSNYEVTISFFSQSPPSCDGSGFVRVPDLHVPSATLAVMATGADAPRESHRLNLIDADSLEVEPVGPEIATPVSLRWDSTGERVVVGGRDGVWVISRTGESSKVRAGRFCGADWSPDDRYIVTACDTESDEWVTELLVHDAPN
jgi:hypothetical protein